MLFSIGVRFNDRITGKVSEFAKHATIIHVDIDPASISRNIVVDIPIVADAKKAIIALLEKAPPYDVKDWQERINSWKSEYPMNTLQNTKSKITPWNIMQEINRVFGHAVITTDVGQNQLWATQFLE